MAMSEKDKRMAAMKRKFDKTTPSNRTGQTIMQRIKNDIFGKKKGMGIDDEKKEMSKANKIKATIKSKPKKDTRLSPGALGGKIKTTTKKKANPIGPKKDAPKGKVKATAGNTKGFASTMAMQKKLIKMGAKIKADGIMGPNTRAAMAKFNKPMDKPKSRPTTKKNVSQGSTIAKDRGKTGFGTSAMSTKGSTKPAEKRYKKSGVTKLTEFQKKLALRDNRRKVIGST